MVIAAPRSGSGKTAVCAGILSRLGQKDAPVRAFKIGPDYIDPGFHRAATGADCVNLDPWGMRPETLMHRMALLSESAALVVGEGAMGLFDGARDGRGSTGDFAARTGLPVFLVIDCRGVGASVAALAEGFVGFDPRLSVPGVILNRVSSRGHERILRNALGERRIPVFGAVRETPALHLPSRHLGLVQASESDGPPLADAANAIPESVVEAVRTHARHFALEPPGHRAWHPPVPPLGQRIAFARDAAFGFVYDAVVEDWRAQGAELRPFSPLADEAPDGAADAVYLPGGYPELHAGHIAANGRFLEGLRAAALRRAAVFGECGGYMVLGRGLVDGNGRRHAMAGLLPLETSFKKRRLSLGYRYARLLRDGPLGAAGTRYAGHEFHYCQEIGADRAADAHDGPLFETEDSEKVPLGRAGMTRGTVSGSFIHLIDRLEAGSVSAARFP